MLEFWLSYLYWPAIDPDLSFRLLKSRSLLV